ncbi:intermembrane transport protein PqiB [Pollutimonas sp. M17]|uniref:PqiB family protein n=1 Tax=Pollutimonas sp. M17 TaxID=2962065 RepID=UPI0021F3EEBD|nr:MlaD family protein [Pollutimonas sp. M17]UYO93111.1 MlaD family protein [Pollutimonas sp. M17]
MNDGPNLASEPHELRITPRRSRPSLIWLVPATAVLIGLAMLMHTWLSEGPRIAITFQTAEGLTAGKTAVKYKDVTIGTVSSIDLSSDGTHVVVHVSLVKSAYSLTHEGTRFWVVRPRIGMHGVSGIDTLLSGAYIAVDSAKSGKMTTSFVGLEDPPAVITGMPGRSFLLHTKDLGSLDIGSPVYYRRIQVGRISAYKLSDGGDGIDIRVFVDSPYENLVTTSSRFWQASGVDLSVNAEGFRLKTQSLDTILAGGITFDSPKHDRGTPAPEQAEFVLAKDQETAFAPPEGPPSYIQLKFDQSLPGLSVGAPVQFSGMDFGRVVSLDLDYDPDSERFPTIVNIAVYPQRLGRVLRKLPDAGDIQGQSAAPHSQFLGSLVERGLRAQVRPGNLLTGQRYIALDFIPDAPKVAFDAEAMPLTLPTIPSSYDQIGDRVASILDKIDKMPLESMGKRLDASLLNLETTLRQINGQVLPEASKTLKQTRDTLRGMEYWLSEDSPTQQSLGETLLEVQRTSRSLRTLTDMLGRNPEALLRGLP